MSNIPGDLRYTKEHTWLRTLPGEVVELGVTDHGQEALGDIVSVELPQVGRHVTAGEDYVSLESTKTVFDVSCPFAGEVTAVNTDLKDTPENVNQDPYGKGWLVRLHVAKAPDSSALLDPSAYDALVKSEGG
jgi:glycine cleavage system H protein